MNIIDAVKSGKRFKRKLPYKQTHWMPTNVDHFDHVTIEDILATDWEVEEKVLPKKKVLKSFVYQNSIGSLHVQTAYQENPEVWCKNTCCKLIKILDEIEVDA